MSNKDPLNDALQFFASGFWVFDFLFSSNTWNRGSRSSSFWGATNRGYSNFGRTFATKTETKQEKEKRIKKENQIRAIADYRQATRFADPFRYKIKTSYTQKKENNFKF
jgi:murein L,D-transpeptidase YafK